MAGNTLGPAARIDSGGDLVGPNDSLHCRIAGRPARIASLARFLDYVQSHDRVWICRRVDIARHWMARHPYSGEGA